MTGQDLKVSDHYKVAAGARYVEIRQKHHNDIAHAFDFGYFEPFLMSTDRVLDFGCGTGAMTWLIARHVLKMESIAVNTSAAQIARTSGLAIYPSLDDLPAEASYDAVVSNHVLEHVRDVPSTLEQLRRRIRRHGLVLRQTYHGGLASCWCKEMVGRWRRPPSWDLNAETDRQRDVRERFRGSGQ